MWNLIKRIKLITLLICSVFLLSSCSNAKSPNSLEKKDNQQERYLFGIDISARKEFIKINPATGNIEMLLRIKSNIYPLQPEKNMKAGITHIAKPEARGKVYLVRIAKAPKPERMLPEEIVKIRFGDIEISPTARMVTGFNEIDAYGSGSFEFLALLIIKPEEEPANDREAEDYVRDLCFNKQIGFSYAIFMDTEPGKQIYSKVELTIPDKVFISKDDVYLKTVNL